MEDAEKAIELDPSNEGKAKGYSRKAEVYFMMGTLQKDANAFEKALENFKKALSLHNVPEINRVIEETEYNLIWVKNYSAASWIESK